MPFKSGYMPLHMVTGGKSAGYTPRPCSSHANRTMEMLMTWKLPLLGALFALAASPALAQGMEGLRGVDRDGDGAIEVAEARAAVTLRFKAMDANRDGTISEKEFTDASMTRISEADADGDGRITRQEIRARAMARWGRQ